MDKSLIERINSQLEKLGITERQASIQATGKPDTIRNIRRGKTNAPRADTLAKLANVLQITPNELMGDMSVSDDHISAPTRKTATTKPIESTLPVYGLAAGSVLGHLTMTHEPFEFVLCPPGLERAKDAYALYVTGKSMEPRYQTGDLVFIHPYRPVRSGDHVVVQEARDGGTVTSIKRFEKYTDDYLVLTQYNPLGEIKISRKAIILVHRVMTTNELFGL